MPAGLPVRALFFRASSGGFLYNRTSTIKDDYPLNRQERHDHLLTCALDVFAEKGYHAASVTDIIERAGVARGTFYLYFESKRSMFSELLDDLFAVIDQRVKRIDRKADAAGVVGQMRSNVEQVISCLQDNRAMLRILLSEAVGLDTNFDQKLSEFYARLCRLIEQSLSLGMDMNLIRSVNTEVVSLCILGSVKEVLYHMCMGRKLPNRDILVEEILRYNVRGLFVPEVAERLGL
jgi:AcrR family transcriptional regulator